MVNFDPIDHYCSFIQQLAEGGAKLTTSRGHEGLTTDMKGRWTIGAFDTSKKNKKETPPMKEVGSKSKLSNPNDQFTKEQQEVMKNFGFEWENYVGFRGQGGWTRRHKGNSYGEDRNQAEVFLSTQDKHPILHIEYFAGGWREEDDEATYHFGDFEELKQKLPQILSLKTSTMKEAVYANNAGIMEMFKFFNVATDAEKKQFDDLVSSGNQNAALKLVEKVLGIKFQGDLTSEERS